MWTLKCDLKKNIQHCKADLCVTNGNMLTHFLLHVDDDGDICKFLTSFGSKLSE